MYKSETLKHTTFPMSVVVKEKEETTADMF